MHKSIILASFLFGSSAFATCGGSDGVWKFISSNNQVYNGAYDCGTFCSNDGPELCMEYSSLSKIYETSNASAYPGYEPPPCKCTVHDYEWATTCPSGQSKISGTNVCTGAPTPPPPYVPDDPNRDLDQHDNDPDGCNNAGGYYFADGSCNSTGEAIQKTFGNPDALVGAMVALGGVGITAFGLGMVPYSAGASAGLVAVGAHAYAAGVGMIAMSGNYSQSSSNFSSSDVSSGETRYKISLDSVSGGSSVTSSNTTTQKVNQATTIPPAVNSALSNSSNVDTSTGQLKQPISLSGVQTTTYDYTNNTATTVTHEATSTSSNPVTTTKTTTITVSQNPDGSVTTTPADSSVAPTVSGSGGGSITIPVNTSGTGTGGTGTGTGTGTGSGDKDYTAVLNDIKKNTGDSASFLDDILGMFDNDTEVDTSKATGSNADGHDAFDSLGNDAKNSFDGFVYSDPLGINALGSSYTVPTYSFNFQGHNFVIFNEAMLNNLPLSLIQNLFMFIAAILAFTTVISGV